MAPHLSLEKYPGWVWQKNRNCYLLFNICLRIYPKTTDPFFRIFENFKVWVKFFHIHLKCSLFISLSPYANYRNRLKSKRQYFYIFLKTWKKNTKKCFQAQKLKMADESNIAAETFFSD
jgi:hypothetical protein